MSDLPELSDDQLRELISDRMDAYPEDQSYPPGWREPSPAHEYERFGPEQVRIVHFISEEVARQYGYEGAPAVNAALAVAWMVDAWEYAMWRRRNQGPPNLTTIEELGWRVEPVKNARGFRTGFVRVGVRVCPPPQEVEPRLHRLMQHIRDVTPEELYVEFEEVHPFVDGNGRVGKILFNWHRGTLDDPRMPPNVWGIANP